MTDFIYSDDSYDRLTSIPYPPPLSETDIYSVWCKKLIENNSHHRKIFCKISGRKVPNAFLNRQYILQIC
ncbi:hypothetical protein EVY06_22400 [Citrobacter koseri]|uniref:Uncharacterized protein n=1 Tax=Citrobacter koseri TaxID=545 RepID=A0AAQ1A7A0_CITKO|nr:hypothetical protein EGX86_16305 [Citrobacter koseri]RSC20172.1 hypothetical protein EGS84_14875 [Citrobacter koseri]RZA63451.1 hypothetical protein EVX99_10100 [Citrobacter koseri]RZA97677.1 hypothetical protein EVY06_22400 [Citrobacter koseri]TFU42704.1 hypothetical protein E4T98_05640 [Citrobacter koseri]